MLPDSTQILVDGLEQQIELKLDYHCTIHFPFFTVVLIASSLLIDTD